MTELYKDQFLHPRIFEIRNGTGWKAEVCVAEDDGNDTIDSRLRLTEIFQSQEAAHHAALAAGRREVERRIEDQDLRSIIDQASILPSTPRRAYGT